MSPTSTAERAATILLVEDNADVLAALERMLAAHGYAVRSARDGEEGLAMALDLQPDLVVLDIGLPKRSGLQVAAELRQRAVRTPVLMLTARGSISDRVSGLDAGADDYLPKPFDFDELLARLRALLRRAPLPRPARLAVGDLTVDPATHAVARDGRP